MSVKALTRNSGTIPSLFDDFFRPWNEWFDNGNSNARMLSTPAANIMENKDGFTVALAVPGLRKEDINIDVAGNLLTISCDNEEENETKEAAFTRKEYSYSAFTRSFTLPEEVNSEKIEAKYENGVLKMTLPKKEEAKKMTTGRHIAVN